jgi:glycosidase
MKNIQIKILAKSFGFLLCLCPLNAYSDSLNIKPKFYPHEFIYDARYDGFKPTQVNVLGDFNGFSSKANPMHEVRPGIFKTTLQLPEGYYFYQFKLRNETGQTRKIKDWIHGVDVSWNHHVSLLYSDPPAKDTRSKYDSNYLGYIDISKVSKDLKVFYDPNQSRFFSFVEPNLLRIIFRIPQNIATIVNIVHRLKTHPTREWKSDRMSQHFSSNGWEYFSITFTDYSNGELEYFFSFSDSVTGNVLGNDLLSPYIEDAYKKPFISSISASKTSPDWAVDAIWYEIMMDRFRNGDVNNDSIDVKNWGEFPQGGNLDIINLLYGWSDDPLIQSPIKSWVKKHRDELIDQYTSKINELSFGGDIQGVIEKLDYLKELGINSLYLTPIFKGHGVHRYHTMDIRHIDDVFGIRGSYELLKGESDDPTSWQWSKSDLLFLNFIQLAHERGIRVVMDLNLHSIYKKSHWFQDVLNNQDKSPYANWFDIYEYGDANGNGALYHSWDEVNKKNEMPSFASTPNLDYSESLKKFLFSAVLRWLTPNGDPNQGVDGFRIDSASSLPIRFAIDLRNFIKSHKPQALLIGENWTDNITWNALNIYDGIEDVEWSIKTYEALISTSKKIYEYKGYLEQLFFSSSISNVMNSWHALNNQDSMRFLSLISNPTAGFHPEILKYQFINTPSDIDYQRLFQAISLQFTCFGAPLIYYGDEVGMWSNGDPFNRAPMIWKDKQGLSARNEEILAFYKKMTTLRTVLSPLRRGNFSTISLDDASGLLGFTRNIKDDYLYIIINRSNLEREFYFSTESDGVYIDYLNKDHVSFNVSKKEGILELQLMDSVGYPSHEKQLRLRIQPWKTMLLRKKPSQPSENRF